MFLVVAEIVFHALMHTTESGRTLVKVEATPLLFLLPFVESSILGLPRELQK